MNTICKLLVGSAAIVGFAVPAAAQTSYPYAYPQQGYAYPQQQQGYAYPQQGYAYPQQQGYAYPQQGYAYPQQGYAYPQQGYPQPGYPQQGYQQNSLAGLIGQLLGNRHNNVGERTAVTQCASAAQSQAAVRYGSNAYGQRNPAYPGYNGYANASSARVTGITNVQRIRSGTRVSGTMSTGGYAQGNQGYGYGNQGYNPGYAQVASNLTFRCNVNTRGAVTSLSVRPMTSYRR